MATRKKAKQYGGEEIPDMKELATQVQSLLSGGRSAASPTVRSVSAPKIAGSQGGRSRGGTFGTKPPQPLWSQKINQVRSDAGFPGPGLTFDGPSATANDGPLTKDVTAIKEPTRNSGKPSMASGFGALIKNGLAAISRIRDAGGDTTEPLAIFGKTLDDYLKNAGDGSNLISGQLSALEGQRTDLTNRAGVGDSKIQEIYAQLANSMGKEGDSATARYADASKQIGQNTDSATAAIQAARANAGAEQSAIARNLGQEDRAPSVAQQNFASDGAAGLSDIAVNGLSGRNLMDTLGTAQADYFQGNKAASQYRGAEARTALQRDLQGQLGNLSMSEAELRDSARQQALQLAQQQYAADYGQFNDQRSYADSVDDRAYNRAQDQYRLRSDYALQQQQIDADRAAAEADAAGSNQPPTFMQIQQQLAQSMPASVAAQAVSAMSEFKTGTGGKGDLRDILVKRGITDPAQIALAMGYAQDFLNAYKY